MSDDKAQDIINRGSRAAQILDDPVFKEAVDKLEAEIIDAWKTWKASDPDGRERLWLGMNALNRIVDQLRTYVVTGRHERKRIEEIAATRPLPYVRSVA